VTFKGTSAIDAAVFRELERRISETVDEEIGFFSDFLLLISCSILLLLSCSLSSSQDVELKLREAHEEISKLQVPALPYPALPCPALPCLVPFSLSLMT
jgi:hypothetical protein